MTEARPFRLLIRVRYAECDAQQVVFNARYGDYVDLAVTEFMRALFPPTGFRELFARGLDNQVVRLDTQWTAPARFDDVLAINVSSARLGRTSYTLNVNFSQAKDSAAVAQSQITYVLVSLGEHRKTPLPDWLCGKLEAGAAGVLVDQSGT